MYGKIKEHLQNELAEIKAAGLYKTERIIESPQRAEIQVAGKPVFEVRMNKFETPGAIASLPTLLPGTNSIGEEADLRYAHTVIDMKSYAETAVLTGKLMLPYESSYRVGAYTAAANCQVEVTIKDGEDVAELGLTDALPFTYGCVTNENGEFALKLPVKNLREGFRIVDATVVPLGATGFTHYVDATGKTEIQKSQRSDLETAVRTTS